MNEVLINDLSVKLHYFFYKVKNCYKAHNLMGIVKLRVILLSIVFVTQIVPSLPVIWVHLNSIIL